MAGDGAISTLACQSGNASRWRKELFRFCSWHRTGNFLYCGRNAEVENGARPDALNGPRDGRPIRGVIFAGDGAAI